MTEGEEEQEEPQPGSWVRHGWTGGGTSGGTSYIERRQRLLQNKILCSPKFLHSAGAEIITNMVLC